MVDLRQAFSDFRQEVRSGIGACTELLERYIKKSNSFPPRNGSCIILHIRILFYYNDLYGQTYPKHDATRKFIGAVAIRTL